MATLSVRGIAASCLRLRGDISVNTDLYGYIFRDTDGSVFGTLTSNDTLPATGQPRTRSLKQHLRRISGRSTDIVVILVGHENDFSGAVTRAQVTRTQYAIQVARDIYAQAQLGVRQIRWTRIPLADAGGYVNISNRGEAQDLTDDWSGPNGGIDLFLVQSIGDAGGWSNVDGPCSKESKTDLSGAVVSLAQSHRFLGVLVAHEVAHYLGLQHANSLSNLMGADTNGDGIGELNNNSTGVTSSQASTMRSHCSVRAAC
ncbi:MAG TPA: hypothetical protein VGF54_22345 [Streptosporangiaceae bacterium]|jgi:hypothetical protein